jgi:hypothetical protein
MASSEHALQRAGAYCQGLGGIPRVVLLTLGTQDIFCARGTLSL